MRWCGSRSSGAAKASNEKLSRAERAPNERLAPRRVPQGAGPFQNGVLLFLAIALLMLWLGLPRAAMPTRVVLPQLHHVELQRRYELEVSRAEQARELGLSTATRTVGELFRREGAAIAAGDHAGARRILSDLRAAIRDVQTAGQESELLLLRGLQGELFRLAVAKRGETGQADAELLELGGNFGSQEWARFADSQGHSSLTAEELNLFFRLRWVRLTGLTEADSFRPDLEEQRAYYSLLLRFPSAPKSDARAQGMDRAMTARALGRVDPHYPVDAAVGMSLAAAGEGRSAAIHLQRYLEQHPDGPYYLSVRNALVYVKDL